jgi:hypothetical protein
VPPTPLTTEAIIPVASPRNPYLLSKAELDRRAANAVQRDGAVFAMMWQGLEHQHQWSDIRHSRCSNSLWLVFGTVVPGQRRTSLAVVRAADSDTLAGGWYGVEGVVWEGATWEGSRLLMCALV